MSDFTALPCRRALLFGVLAGALALAQAQGPAVLRIGVEAAHPLVSELAPDGQLKGFDIDIANALCAKLAVNCAFIQTEFDAMIPALRSKKFDAIVASMSITPERLKAVDFSGTYDHSSARVVVKPDSAIDGSAASLKGRRVGVQRGTLHDRCATARFGGATITRDSKRDEVLLVMLSGRLDASWADSVAIDQGFLKTPSGQGYAMKGPAYDDPAFFGPGAGIAVRKSDRALRDTLDAALRADGGYKRINDTYFDFDIYGAEPAKK